MKKFFNYPLLFLFAALMVFSACKKEDEELEVLPSPGEQMGSTDDAARQQIDASYDQVMDILNNQGSYLNQARTADEKLPCGVFRVDTSSNGFKVRYDSTKNCNNKVLSGSIDVKLESGTYFNDSLAVLSMTYNNYTVLFSANQETLIYNGTLRVTNLTGGGYGDLTTKGYFHHGVRGSLQVTFDNQTTRTWRITRRRIWRQTTPGDWLTTEFQLDSDSAGMIESGKNKDGNDFEVTVTSPLTWKNCGTLDDAVYKLYTGEFLYRLLSPNHSMRAQGGYKLVNGKAEPSQNCDAEGYRLIYDIDGVIKEVFQYY